MRLPLLITLTCLGGCHLFANGSIPCARGDLSGCFPDTGSTDTDTGVVDSDSGGDSDTDTGVDSDTSIDTDTGGDTDTAVATSLGIALSLAVDGNWQAEVWKPSHWVVDAPDLYRNGSGSGLGGPAAFDDASDTLYVAAPDTLYGLRDRSATTPTSSWPVSGTVHDLAVLDGILYLAIDAELYELDPAGSSEITHIDLGSSSSGTTGWASLNRIFSGQGGIYAIGTETDGSRSLGFYDPSTGAGAVVYNSFDPDGSYTDGDGFMGPSDKAYTCSSDGAVYLAINLYRGDTTPYAQAFGLPSGDVLACGWDDTLEMFLIFSASTGILGVDASGNQESLLVPDGDFEIYGGNVF